MLIGQSSHWTWAAFAARMVPIGIVCLVINGLVLKAIYHRQLPPARSPSMVRRSQPPGPPAGEDGAGAPRPATCLPAGRADGCCRALGGRGDAGPGQPPTEKTFAAVDWSLLLFFAGLFVVAAGVTKAEAAWIGRLLPEVTRQVEQVAGLLRFSAASVAGSNLFSNVPFVMLLRGWIAPAPHAELLWLCLAASSTLAGNLTLVGSAANLIVAHGAQAEHPLSFWAFLRVGILSTAHRPGKHADAVVAHGSAACARWAIGIRQGNTTRPPIPVVPATAGPGGGPVWAKGAERDCPRPPGPAPWVSVGVRGRRRVGSRRAARGPQTTKAPRPGALNSHTPGADEGSRTLDPRITNALLWPLSYVGSTDYSIGGGRPSVRIAASTPARPAPQPWAGPTAAGGVARRLQLFVSRRRTSRSSSPSGRRWM